MNTKGGCYPLIKILLGDDRFIFEIARLNEG